jgi:hypothetical protein
MDSPLKKVAVRGEVESQEPYIVKLTNIYDDSKSIQAKLALDKDKRSVVITTGFDIGKRCRPGIWLID